MAIKAMTLTLLCPLVTACTLGPDFVPPTPAAPTSYDRAAAPATPSQTVENAPVNAAWWQRLHDPLLDRLVTQLATQNFDLRLATERLEQSRQQRNEVASQLYPQVHGDASYTREKISDKGVASIVGGGAAGATGGAGGGAGGGGGGAGGGAVPNSSSIPPFNIYEYGFDASWELDLWGKTRRTVEAANAGIDAAEESRRGMLISSIAELVRDYVQLRGLQASVQVTQSNLQAANALVTLTVSKARSGLSNQSDVANARAQAASIAAELPPLIQQSQAMMNAIALLLAKPPGALDNELAAVKPIPPLPPQVPIGVPAELAKRRPDIRQAEAALHAATANIGIAKAQFFPTVTLTGNGMLQALKFSDLNSWAAKTYTFGPQMTLPIFEGGRLVANLKLSESTARQATLEYEKTVLNAFHEVDNALTQFRSAQQRHAALIVSVAQNREAVALAASRYSSGLRDYLEVLTARQNLYAAQQQATRAAEEETDAMAQLYKALGGGWENDPATMP